MKKVLNIIAKVLLTLLMIMPILGATGIFPAPTADMYSNPTAFAFINALMTSKYIMIINAVIFAISIVLLWTKRTALAALLIAPITVNIVAFHAFMDGGLLTPGASMGDILMILNLYFFWQNRDQYMNLLKKVR